MRSLRSRVEHQREQHAYGCAAVYWIPGNILFNSSTDACRPYCPS